MNPSPEVNMEDPLVRVCEMLLSSGHRGVPVSSESGEYKGFISRKDISSIIPSLDELKKTRVKDHMTPDLETIRGDQHVGKAKAMMERYDVRVLPVVDNHGKLIVLVGIQDILDKVTRPIGREEKGDMSGEIDSPRRDVDVDSVMSEPAITTEPNSMIYDAAEKMNEEDISTLVAIDGDEIKGVLTQFDLIGMITSFREADQVFVQISGLKGRHEDYDQIYDVIQRSLSKVNRVLDPLVLNVHVVSHQEEGTQAKYSMRLRLSTDYGMYYAKEVDWNMMKALDKALDSLERRIFQDKEKKLERKRDPKHQAFMARQEGS